MISYELMYKELDELGITIDEFDLKSCNALTLCLNGKYYIAINSNKNFSEMWKFWIIEHEIEHIKHGTFYHMNDDKFIINKNERITNDALVTKLGLIQPVLDSIYRGLDKWEICSNLEMPYEIYDCCIDYIKRKELMNMKNCAALLCKNEGYTADILAKKLGCTIKEAEGILNQSITIKYEYILRMCQIFSVSQEYLLCING